MRFKRGLCMILAVLTVTLVAGCGKKISNNGGDWENAPKVYYAIQNKWESKIGKAGDDIVDNDYTRYIFEKTGVRLIPVPLSSNSGEASQQLALKRAGGQQIDLLNYMDLQQAFMESGLIIKINDLLEKYHDIAPNIEANIPDSAWKGATKRGEIWGLPSRSVMPNPPISYVFIRQDWLDNLGLEMPKSTDDLGKILKAFTENDPDGNGKNDTYGLCHYGSNLINELLLFFGVDSWREDIVDGDKLVAQAMTDRAREAYKIIREWNMNGYMCEDGITDTKALENMITSNRVGVYIGTGADVVKYCTALRDNGYTDANWALCTEQIVSSLDNKFYGYGKANNFASMTMITSMAKDYDSIFKLLNWFYSPEGTFFQSYGIEGKEYSMKDGKPVEDKDYIYEKSYLDMFAIGKSYNTYYEDQAYRVYGDDEFGKTYVSESINNIDKYCTERTDIKFQYPELAEFSMYPDWRKGIEKNMMKFVVGDLDPADDSVWQSYIDDCNSYGIQKLLDAAAKKYFNK